MKRKLYCYSRQEFDTLMENLGWENKPDNGYSTISISSSLDEKKGHWFNIDLDNNVNLDFNDVDPNMWWKVDYYDDSLELFKNDLIVESNNFFEYQYNNIKIHAMNYLEALSLVKFIDNRINLRDNIYVHCSAGASRSQAVIRYILDMYPNIEWETRLENPCLTPNYHVVRMLKRMFNYSKNS